MFAGFWDAENLSDIRINKKFKSMQGCQTLSQKMQLRGEKKCKKMQLKIIEMHNQCNFLELYSKGFD